MRAGNRRVEDSAALGHELGRHPGEHTGRPRGARDPVGQLCRDEETAARSPLGEDTVLAQIAGLVRLENVERIDRLAAV